jgi:soluble lytic murein transglycosylase
LGLKLQVVLRGLLSVLVLLCTVFPGASLAQTPALERALAEMRAYRWDAALQIAEQDGQMARDIIEWHRLRAGHGTYDEVTDFLDRRPDWPGLALMRKNSEKTLIGRSGSEVLAYFSQTEPQTPTGAILLAQAWKRAGKQDQAAGLIADVWVRQEMSDAEFEAITKQFGDLIQPLVTERLDSMLWQANRPEVARLLPMVDSGWTALANARLALRDDKDGVDALIAAVPAALRDHPGLAYERFKWRLRRGRTDEAQELLRAQSARAATLGKPAYWAADRRNIARGLMWDGHEDLAYELAANHHLSDPDADYADLEWIAGYVALKQKNDPATAVGHFAHLLDAVDGPISLARAGYWLGRAYAAQGKQDAARLAYEQAAEHSTAFYGLLAAEALGQSPEFTHSDILQDAWRTAAFTRTSTFQAGLICLALDELYLAERFFVQLSESLDDTELTKLSQMLEQMNQPHLALRVAKHGVRMGELSLEAYFPIHPMSAYKLPVNPELVMSIARRESEFDPEAVSRAGAKGLLQLMPGTASQMAKQLGLPDDNQRLVTDWKYNAALGSAYLAELVRRFDGNVVLVAAAYNAGPNRAAEWVETFGDPRTSRLDIVDWIESIPYRETRNYVMRVSESLPAYRARLGITPPTGTFSEELAGSTLYALAP